MAMINMKSKPEMKKDEYGVDAPEYPYGLCIDLRKEQLAKLSITALPEIGSTMKIHANVFVKSTYTHNDKNDGKDSSVTLQITDMEILPAEGKSNNDTMSAMLYGAQVG